MHPSVFQLMDGVDSALYRVLPGLVPWKNATLNVTGLCNSQCIMCNHRSRYEGRRELDTAAWKRIIDRMHAFGIENFLLAGGEALQREDFLEIAAHCRGTRSFITNGTLIDEGNAAALAGMFRLISVSVDASTPELYQKIRGLDCFQRVMENVERLLALGASVRICYAINKHNVSDVVSMARLTQRLNIKLVLSLVVYEGFNQVFTKDRSLREDIAYGELVEQVRAALAYDHVLLWIALRDQLQGRSPRKCYGHVRGPIVDPAGDVYLCCGNLPAIGNLCEASLEEMWAIYARRKDLLVNMGYEACRNCLFYAGEAEYLQSFLRKVSARPIRLWVKRRVAPRGRAFLAGR